MCAFLLVLLVLAAARWRSHLVINLLSKFQEAKVNVIKSCERRRKVFESDAGIWPVQEHIVTMNFRTPNRPHATLASVDERRTLVHNKIEIILQQKSSSSSSSSRRE